MRQKLVSLAGVMLPRAQSDVFDGTRERGSLFGGSCLTLTLVGQRKLFCVIVSSNNVCEF